MKFVVVGTAGHIDHGKSTLVRALTGIDPDRLKEEKARGITIDLGFAHDVRGAVTLAFVDVPGHERFVKNMLAGATGIDVLLLVVAADESVMPQTREHFDICRLLDVRRGVVALTKADVVDAETLELARLEVRELVKGSFLDGAPIVPVSSVTGLGLEDLREALVRAADRPGRRRDGPFRMPVDRVFSVRGFGTVATGTVTSGSCRVDDAVVVLPPDSLAKVRSLQGHGAALLEVGAGQRAAVNLGGIDVEQISRGDCIVAAGAFECSQRLDARLDVLPSARPLKHGSRVRFHLGTGETLGRVAIGDVVGPVHPEEDRVGEAPGGARAYVRVRLERPIVVTRGDAFVLRAYSPPVTIAGGVVLDPHPQRTAIRSGAGRRRFRALDHGEGDLWEPAIVDRVVSTLVHERGASGLTRRELVTRVGLSDVAVADVLRRASLEGTVVPLANVLVAPTVLAQLGDRVVEMLTEYHRADPLSSGIPRGEIRERLFSRADPAVFEEVLDRLAAGGRVAGKERLAMRTHRVSLPPEEEALRLRIDRTYRDADLRPPDPGALAAVMGASPAAVDRVLTLLNREKALVRLENLWFHAEALERLRAAVRALKVADARATLDVTSFKERFGVSRKFAIPLLEYLDRERVTRRTGDTRVVL